VTRITERPHFLVPDLTKAPMGGTLVPGGATFRIWAPRAKSVYVSGDFNGWKQDSSRKDDVSGLADFELILPRSYCTTLRKTIMKQAI
jgi:1,4-alpha-glucan branching enzyme